MNKNIYYTIIIVAVIIIGIFIYNSFKSVSGSFGENDLGLDEKNIAAFSVRNKGITISFERKDSVWNIVKPIQDLADQQKVKNLISSFAETKLIAPLSSNPEKQDLFGVDSAADKFSFDGKTFFVGKVGPDFQTTYLRQEGDNQVNIFSGLLSSSVNASINEFRNKDVFKIETKKVKSVEVKNQSETFIIVRDSSNWSVDGLKIDDDKMNPFTSSLFDLTGDEIVDTLNTEKFSSLIRSFSVSVLSDKKETINFYKVPEKTAYIVNREGSNRIYSIQEYRTDRFNKPKTYWQTTEKNK